ncbi:hypothetical protein [Novosphingobium sp. Gsoil 351]|uniref:hypothetical protein n=1 Tax=Novosphingobium sp. Gsoil 351 TaxID=2675225 RepID=UPI0012B4CDA8|nr:hypothetical protein [Novosphingobium sp. Gsoil 351]QGN53300.1 hypothetical protein GKE62_00755 [Novosphingobium sp. Gsoil 351]
MITPILSWQLASPEPAVTIAAAALLVMPVAIGAGAIYAAIAEMLPQQTRATSLALIYTLPVTLVGGTTQLVLEWLIHVTGDPLSICWYLTAVALIAAIAGMFLPESAPVRRNAAPELALA